MCDIYDEGEIMPQVKCSLFSEDGKLLSPSSTEKSVKKIDVNKELEGIKSTRDLKKSLFSDSGKLNVKPTTDESDVVVTPDEAPKEVEKETKDVKVDEGDAVEVTVEVAEELKSASNEVEAKAESAEELEPASNEVKNVSEIAEELKPADNEVVTTEKKVQMQDPKDEDLIPEPSESKNLSHGDSVSDFSHGLDYLDGLLDDDTIEDEEEELLKWSSDSPHHLSDYYIEVENRTSGSSVKYYVHKLVLSTGPTKCEFFEKKFADPKGAADGKTISVSHSAADAFPALLDFLYSRDDSLDLHSDNAVALRHLGKLFVIKKLVMMVTRFIRKDLTPHKSLHYLNCSFEFRDVSLIDTAARVCAGAISTVNRDGLTSLDPYLFSKVVTCDNVACTSEELSKMVAEFCRKHDDVLSCDLLRVVTGIKNMPSIDDFECVYLLQLAEKYDTDKDSDCNLKGRCILSGSEAWNGTIVPQLKVEPEAAGPYDELSAELKVDLLQDSLIQAKKDFNDALARKEEALTQFKADASKSMRIQQSTHADHEKKLKALETECEALKKELSSFKRLPADYKFPKNRVQYTYHSQGEKFGKDKPSAQPPSKGNNESAGVVVIENGRVWPVYYYCS